MNTSSGCILPIWRVIYAQSYQEMKISLYIRKAMYIFGVNHPNNCSMRSFFKASALFLLAMYAGFSCSAKYRTSISLSSDTTASEQASSAIKLLKKHPKVIKAVELILELEAETRKNHILLTEIPAPPFKEEKRAAKYAEMIRHIGADSVWIDQEGNVIALRKGNGTSDKVIAIDAHLDTVFPEDTDVSVKFSGDTLRAPGIGDDTRSLAALLTVLKVMNQSDIRTKDDVLFIGSVGEEGQGDLRGMKYLYHESDLKPDVHIALDGTAINRVVNGGVGSHRYRIAYKSNGGHSYGSFGMVNAHVAMGKAISYWADAADAYLQQKGPRTTYSVSVLGGGTSVNSIPFESWMEVDMRSESQERLKVIDSMLMTSLNRALDEVNAAKTRGKDLKLEVKMMGDRPSGMLPIDNSLVQHMIAVIESQNLKPILSSSSTNSNVPLALGIPSITIGSGGIAGGAHSLDEWFVNYNGHKGIESALLILLAEAGTAP